MHDAGRPRQVALRARDTPSRGRGRARGRRGQRLADGRAVRGPRALVRPRVRQDRPRVGGPAVLLRDGGPVRGRKRPTPVRVRRGARLGAVRRARSAPVRPFERRRRGPGVHPRAPRGGRGAEATVVADARGRIPGRGIRRGAEPADGLASAAGRARGGDARRRGPAARKPGYVRRVRGGDAVDAAGHGERRRGGGKRERKREDRLSRR
mmetsp:Transcript_1017/g.3947  ORF Transcript_1017/g.3947 Transcript_1017/m.3947 type:complete len:209 (-) Transcript_1017:365-991(-)